MAIEYSYNSCYLIKDGRPWFPIMGEMHYSRYPAEYWKESLLKMKAGGVDVVSAYVIWIHHEEAEKEYDFRGSKDLRRFLSECADCGLSVMLRIGPWVHGEVRNGGFPDWLLKKGIRVRTNDPAYFEEVKRYYSVIFNQVKGLLHKDKGPIIGIQIENEYGHVGGLTGEEGEKHMRILKQIALDAGFVVPYYTATGWGGAVTGGMLPVMGGYCDAPWDQRLDKLAPNGNYVFTYERNDHNIGSDYGLGAGLTFDYRKYPFLTAELGGGLQVTHHRRPVARGRDIGAMSLVKLGCGVNLLGYYMYHGGTNPKGRFTGLQESRDTGYPNDLPELSYDFRAPIREYGQISDTFREIKLLTMFIKDFGENLCRMEAYIPEDNPLTPDNLVDIRHSIRHDGESGYVFVNNYQRAYEMASHRGVVLKAEAGKEIITFPPVDIYDGDYFFFPINMKLKGDLILKSALATPLCVLDNDIKAYVFYTDREPYYDLKGNPDGVRIITLSREDAKNAWKVRLNSGYKSENYSEYEAEHNVEHNAQRSIEYNVQKCVEHNVDNTENNVQKNTGHNVQKSTGHNVQKSTEHLKEHLIICSDFVLQEDRTRQLYLYGKGSISFKIFPDLPDAPAGFVKTGTDNEFGVYEKLIYTPHPQVDFKLVKETGEHVRTYELTLNQLDSNANDVFLHIDYAGNMARLYLGDELIADDFYTGTGWDVGLKRFGLPDKLILEVYPLKQDDKIYLEKWPPMKDGLACALNEVQAVHEYMVRITV